MRRTLMGLMLILAVSILLAGCGGSEAPAPGQPTAAPTASSQPLQPVASPSPTGQPRAVVTPPPRPAAEPAVAEAVVRPLDYGSPLFPKPFLPVQGGSPEFLAAGQFIEGQPAGLLLVMGNYSAEVTAWLWPTLNPDQPQPRSVNLGGTGMPYAALADFNEDGLDDLAYLSDNAIHLRLSSAGGPLAEPVDVARQGRPTGLVTGDFDGDGHVDLVASFDPNYSGHEVDLLPGDGNGGLGASSASFQVGGGNPPLATADFNRDGADDLVAVDNEAGLLHLFYGGSVPFERTFAATVDALISAVGAGDLTGDALPDMVVLLSRAFTDTAELQIWPGTASEDRPFESPQVLGISQSLGWVQLEDYNDDGLRDMLLTPRYSPGDHLLLLRDPDQPEGQGPGWQQTRIPLQPAANLIALADFNGDRLDDLAGLAQIGNSSQGIALLPGSPAGWLAPGRLTAAGDVWAVTAADFNRDGWDDLAVARSSIAPDSSLVVEDSGGKVELYLGSSNGYLLNASRPTGLNPLDLLAVDIDGDGAVDLLSADYGSGQISRFLGDGQGGLQAVEPLPAGLNPRALAAGDLNDDGLLDLVVANATSGEIDIWLGGDGGQFTPGESLFVGQNPWALVLTDFDDDGWLDLVVAQANFNTSEEPGRVLLYPGQGDGTFGPPAEIVTGPNPSSLAAADFDGDGAQDLAVAFSEAMTRDHPIPGSANDGIVVLLGLGDGTFDEAWRSADVPHPHHLVVADFDGDGVLDLAAGGAGGGSPWLTFHVLSVLPGRGDGSFAPAQSFGDGEAVRGIATLDANHDGRLDLVLAQPGNGAQLYTNSPTLAPAVAVANPEPPPPPLPSPSYGPAPNPAPGYPASWQPLVVAGSAQIELPQGARIYKLLFNTEAGLLYALDSVGAIHVLNSVSLQPEATWPVNAQDILLDAAGQRLFVARRDADETLLLDPVSGRQQSSIPRAGQLALDNRRDRLFIVKRGVWLAEPATGRVLGALPASFQLFTGYVYSPGNLSALVDEANDRLVVKGTLGGPGSSGSVQHTHVYDGETLARLPIQYNRSYWLPDMAVSADGSRFYATAAALDGSMRQLTAFAADGSVISEIAGVGGWILQGASQSPLYLVDRERLITVDVPTFSVVDFTPLPGEATAAASEPGANRLVVALPAGDRGTDGESSSSQLLVYVPAAGSLPQPGPGAPLPALPAGHPVVDLLVDGDLLLARVAGPAESYGWPRELYRSTDGGVTWQRIDAAMLGAYPEQMVLQPGRGEQATLWVQGFHGTQPAGVFRAYDSGEYWQLVDIGLRHLRLTDLVLASGTEDTLFALNRLHHRLYRSTDQGSSWVEVHEDASNILLSPHFGQDRTIWIRRTTSVEPYAVSTDGGDTWQTTAASPWWQKFEDADFFFTPNWPERGAAYKIAGEAAWVKPADGTTSGGGVWQPFDLPRAKGYLEQATLYFRQDEQFLAFYSKEPGELYWTEDAGQSWQLLLDGPTLGGELTAVTVDPARFAADGTFWLGTGDGQVRPARLEEWLAATRSLVVTPAAPPAPTPTSTPGPLAGDTPPDGLAVADPRLIAAWEQVSAQLGWGIGPAQPMFMAWEPFQRGQMIWLSSPVASYPAIAGPTVVVVTGDDGWQAVPDAWDESQPESDPGLTSPAGLVQPVRGFGKVWREQPGVQDGLGWAVEPEAGFDGLVQGFEHGLMIRVEDRVYALIQKAEGSSSWLEF